MFHSLLKSLHFVAVQVLPNHVILQCDVLVLSGYHSHLQDSTPRHSFGAAL